MTVAFSAWNPDIKPFFPGIPSAAIDKAILDASIEFCEDTHVWMGALDRISIVADQKNYTLSVPTGEGDAHIHFIENVKYKEDGEDDDQFYNLVPIVERRADRQWQSYSNWKFTDSTAPIAFYFDPNTVTLSLYPIPNKASSSGLLVRVAYTPANDATALPDFLYDNYRKAIQFGAMAQLYSQTAMPWALPQAAGEYMARFEEAKAAAKLTVMTGGTSAPLTIAFMGDDWL